MSKPTDTTLVGQDLRNHDLRHRDLSKYILFGTDLRGARLRNAIIALDCAQFDGVKLSNDQVAMLLLLIAKADIGEEWTAGIRELVHARLGWHAAAALAKFMELT